MSILKYWSQLLKWCFIQKKILNHFTKSIQIKKVLDGRIGIQKKKKGDDGQLNYLMLACTQEGNSVPKIPILKILPTQVAKREAKIITSKVENGVWSFENSGS